MGRGLDSTFTFTFFLFTSCSRLQRLLLAVASPCLTFMRDVPSFIRDLVMPPPFEFPQKCLSFFLLFSAPAFVLFPDFCMACCTYVVVCWTRRTIHFAAAASFLNSLCCDRLLLSRLFFLFFLLPASFSFRFPSLENGRHNCLTLPRALRGT